MKLALFSGLLSLLLSALGLWCYQTTIGEPWNCIPLMLPNFLVVSYFDQIIGSKKELAYAGILIGSFIEFFIVGYIASLILKVMKRN